MCVAEGARMDETEVTEYVATRSAEATERQNGIFASVWNHFLVANEVFAYDGDRCRYQWPDGARCAVGLFIPDDAYEPSMERHNVIRLVRTGALPGVIMEDVPLLARMQTAHDTVARSGVAHGAVERAAFSEHMIGIAELFGLRIPEDA